MKNLGKKLALVFATTAVGVTMFAAVATAAVAVDPPVLSDGFTSGGLHDTRGPCAMCHSYEAVASPLEPSVAAPVVVVP